MRHRGAGGFTLVELILVMIIVGVMAAVVAPRLMDTDVFRSRGFADQVQSALRFAQKEAIARHRLVCVALTAATVTLTVAANSADVACTLSLALPSGESVLNSPSSGIVLGYSSPNFNFDALGRTAAQQLITISGTANNVVVEAETGYVHSP